MFFEFKFSVIKLLNIIKLIIDYIFFIMNTLFYTLLFIYWTLFWSFASVIIYRLKSWEKWILNWRSHCGKCNKILNFFQLIPIFSWLFSRWKCNYCKKKISSIYPILEISTWILYCLIWYFLIDFNLLLELNIVEIYKLFFWLWIWFISILYIFYDILFLEIHEWILSTWIVFILVTLWIQTMFPPFYIINTLPIWMYNINVWLSSIIISFSIIWLLYIIMLKELHEFWDISILILCTIILYLFKTYYWVDLSDITIINWVIWALWIFIFFFLQIIISNWTWIGWWDLRIAILIWLILWVSLNFAWTMIIYMTWSVIWIWLIIWSKIKNGFSKKFNTTIPFGPFLAIWFFITVFLKNDIIKLIEKYFQNM